MRVLIGARRFGRRLLAALGFVGMLVTIAAVPVHAAPLASDPPVWTIGPGADTTSTFTSVTCVSSTECRAVQADGSYQYYGGSDWMGPMKVGHEKISALDCAAAQFCMAVAGNDILEYDGTDWWSWTSYVPVPNISCTSKSFCLIGSNPAVTFDGTNWNNVASPFPGSATGSVSCAAVNACVTVAGGRAWSFDGTTWSSAGTVDAARKTNGPLSCGSRKLCAVVDGSAGISMYDGSAWKLAPGTAGARAVSCPTAAFCAATGDDGMLMTYEHGRWSKPIRIPPVNDMTWPNFDETSSAISCAGPNFCLAISGTGETAIMTRGADTYHARTPARLFDTRTGAGGVPKAKLGARQSVRVKVAGTHGIPANATAVALNVTAVGASQPTFVTVYPYGSGRPQASTLNPASGAATANFTIVKIGAGGYISVYNDAGRVDVLADVAGFFTADAAGYHALTPVRLFDTRTGAGGVPKAKLGARQSVRVKVAGTHGIPANATAVALNVTAVGASQPTFVTVYPYGSGRPQASTLNPAGGPATANFTTVKIGAGGYISVYNDAGRVNVLADVAGYYGAGAEYHAVDPIRVFDTRNGAGSTLDGTEWMPAFRLGRFAKQERVHLGGAHALPLSAATIVPPNVTAIALNITAVGATKPTFITLFPDGEKRPLASTLNPAGPAATANFTIVKPGPGGYVDVYNDAGQVNVVIDVVGYYTASDYVPLMKTVCALPCGPW